MACKCIHRSPFPNGNSILERWEDSKCVCDSNARLFAEENGKKVEIKASDYKVISKVFVDTRLLSQSDDYKCDLLFCLHEKTIIDKIECDQLLYVEFKGCDVEHAYKQIKTADSILKNKIISNIKNAVIICKRIPKYNSKSAKLSDSFKREISRRGKLIISTIKGEYKFD